MDRVFSFVYLGDVVGVNHYYQYTTKAVRCSDGRVKNIPIKYVPKKGKDYVKGLAAGMRSLFRGEPLDGLISVGITYRYKDRRAEHDLDNILKPIQDALMGVVILDDKQIVKFHRLEKVLDKENYGFDLDIVLIGGQGEDKKKT